MKTLTFLAILLASLSAEAAQITECGSLNNLEYVSEPWEKNTRTYGNGKVRTVRIDTYGEPACCSTYLLMLVAQEDELGTMACYALTSGPMENGYAMGFQSVDFAKIASSYDPAKGLLLEVPYETYVDGVDSIPGRAKVRINLGLGTAGIE